MIGLFKRPSPAPRPDTAALGQAVLALGVPARSVVPLGCLGVAFDKAGATRRIEPGGRIELAAHERALCFHPGPYSVALTPFASAPELGLQLDFIVDAADPRVTQQRFDLYLASEAGEQVTLSAFAGAIEMALQRELAQGNLELPPCTSPDEWNQFRAGFNRLLYQRFGVTVEDCLPVDLADRVDYAQLLLARAACGAAAAPGPVANPVALGASALADAQALRRLFLELPSVTCALRLVPLAPGQATFRQHQLLLQRLDHARLLFETMPPLALLAPGQALGSARQATRSAHSAGAVAALDEAWALAARFAQTPQERWLDDADRIIANLEHHGAGRKDAP